MTSRAFVRILTLLGAVLVLSSCGEEASGGGSDTNTTVHASHTTVPVVEHDHHDHANHDHANHDHANHDHAPLAAHAPLPGQSLYHLASEWTDHHGEPLKLADLRGKPVVAVMFYASCDTACPLLIRDALRLQESLPEHLASEVQFLLITIDPERDAPERLARYVDENELEADNWHFVTGSPTSTRALAALLGVRYRPAGNGMYSHTNLITVLSPDGVIAERTEGLNQPVEPALKAIEAMVANEAG